MKTDEEVIAEMLAECDEELRVLSASFRAAPGPPSTARDAYRPELDELLERRLMIMEASE